MVAASAVGFGDFGGRFVPETLVPALEELEATKGSYEELLGTDESEGTAPTDDKTDNPTPTEPPGEDGK